MATSREDLFNYLETDGKAVWGVGVPIQRLNGLPLDKYSVFSSREKLDEYLAGNFSYPGQLVALVTESAATAYIITADGELQEIGSGGSSSESPTWGPIEEE